MMVIDASVAAKWFIVEPGAHELWPTVWLAKRAFEIASELRHPVYDCFYLALAEREDAALVTADRRLIRRLAGSRWEALCRPLVA
jgi:predicted nucleic acid-binding protein